MPSAALELRGRVSDLLYIQLAQLTRFLTLTCLCWTVVAMDTVKQWSIRNGSFFSNIALGPKIASTQNSSFSTAQTVLELHFSLVKMLRLQAHLLLHTTHADKLLNGHLCIFTMEWGEIIRLCWMLGGNPQLWWERCIMQYWISFAVTLSSKQAEGFPLD